MIFVVSMIFVFVSKTNAAFNRQINYQGKLTDASNLAVPDGLYTVEFNLYTQASGGSPIWTEINSGANRVQVTNGLFSVMMGSTTPFTGVDFGQTLYLGVKIESDAEMTPRKVIGAVPAAFVADTLNGISSNQFLRSDIQNATSSSGTFLNILQSGVGKIAEFFGPGSNSALSILSSGNIGVGTSTPTSKLTVIGNTYLSGDITATGTLTILGTATSSIAGGLTVGTNKFVVDRTTWNIGINTAYPQSGIKLDIRSDAAIDGSSALTGYGYNGNGGIGIRGYGYAISGTGDNYAVYGVSNGSRGSGTNIGGYFTASGAANNYALTTGNGNVGIGSSSPVAKLSVKGSGTGTGRAFEVTDSSNNSRFVISDNGNVGIGTTNPGAKLSISAGAAGADTEQIRFNRTNDDLRYSSIYYTPSASAGVAGILSFKISDGVTTTSQTNTMTLNGGNVGIGTTTPTRPLDVVGTGFAQIKTQNFTSNQAGGVEVFNNLGDYIKMESLGSAFSGTELQNQGILYSSDELAFGTNGRIERMRISASGNVGIGTTSPSSKLQIEGSAIGAASSDYSIFTIQDTSGNGLNMGYDSNNNWSWMRSRLAGGQNRSIAFFTNSSSSNSPQFVINTSGNVGIGTTTTNAKLTVVGSMSLTGAFYDSLISAGTNGMVLQTTGSGTQWVATSSLGFAGSTQIGSGTQGQVPFYNANGSTLTATSSLFIAQSGNVGIGTTTPAEKLSVVGNIVVSGNNKLIFDDTANPTNIEFNRGGSGTRIVPLGSFNQGLIVDLDYNGSSAFDQFTVRQNGTTDLFSIVNSGNVGIGTTSPVAKLSVTGSGLTTGKAFEITDSDNTPKFTVLDNGLVTLADSINIGATGSYQQNGTPILYASTTSYNTFVGADVGRLLKTNSGNYNSALGYRALYNATSSVANIAIGYQSLYSMISGNYNVGIGQNALFTATTSKGNVAVGYSTLQANTTGTYNVATGYNVLNDNTTGSFNVGISLNALQKNTTGSYNIGIGREALDELTTGSGNTAVGYFAGSYDASVSDYHSVIDNYATFIGYNARRSNVIASTTALNNITAIGKNAMVSTSNSLVLGGTGSDAVNVGIGTTSPATLLELVGASTAPKIRGSYASAGDYGEIDLYGYGTGIMTIRSGTGFPIYFNNGSTNRMVMTSGGNLGIGTTTPARMLELGTGGDIRLNGISGYYGEISNDSGFMDYDAYGSGAFHTWSVNNTEYMRLLSDGRFGIGSTTPIARLSIAGIGLTTGKAFEITDSANASKFTISDNGNVNMAAGTSLLYNGAYAMQASTSIQNWFFGNSGNLSATGNYNTSLGYNALHNVTSGSQNVAIGFNALANGTSSNYNIALGPQTMGANTTGTANIAIGFQSLTSNTIGIYNTAIGYRAGWGDSVTNDQKTVIDDYATFVGYRASRSESVASTTKLTNITAIGKDARVGASNTIVLGGTGADAVKVGIGTTTPFARLSVVGDLALTGGIYDSATSLGSAGYILQSTGTSTIWVATSSLGIIGGGSGSGVVNSGLLGQMAFYAGNGTTVSGTSTIFALNENVGIGTTTPMSKLTISGNIYADYFTMSSSTATSTIAGNLSVDNGAITYNASTGITTISSLETGALNFDTDAGAVSWVDLPISSATAGTVESYSAQIGSTPVLTVYGESDGSSGAQNLRLGIGTTTPSSRLALAQSSDDVSGGILLQSTTGSSTSMYVTATGTLAFNINGLTPSLSIAGAWTNSSDIAYKKDVVDLGTKYGLADLLKTTPRYYKMKNSDIEQIGFIAQELEQIVPEVVTGEDGSKGITYGNLVALSFQSIKELNEKVDNMASSTIVSSDSVSVVNTAPIVSTTTYTTIIQETYTISTSTIASTTASLLETSEAFIGMIANSVKNLIASTGDWVIARLSATYVYSKKIEAETVAISQGLEMKDQLTGQVYCIVIKNGDWDKRAGSCSELSQATTTEQIDPIIINTYIPSINDNTSGTSTLSTDISSTTNATTTDITSTSTPIIQNEISTSTTTIVDISNNIASSTTIIETSNNNVSSSTVTEIIQTPDPVVPEPIIEANTDPVSVVDQTSTSDQVSIPEQTTVQESAPVLETPAIDNP